MHKILIGIYYTEQHEINSEDCGATKCRLCYSNHKSRTFSFAMRNLLDRGPGLKIHNLLQKNSYFVFV